MRLENIGFYTLEDNRARNACESSPLWRCELLLTSKCNFNCPYCRGTDNSANITFKQAKKIVDFWADEGLKNVRFSGGEPTCVKWLPDLVSYTNEKPSIKRIAISTNGSADVDYYIDLHKRGVNDFSISLDACCSSFGDKMSGVRGVFKRIVESIKTLSKLTYVTTGCVFDATNFGESLKVIKFAHNLGVSDIRIISSAQYNIALKFAKTIPQSILKTHPILKYRVKNYRNGRNVRGMKATDFNKCPLMLDDMAIKGNYHYPCIIKMREGCAPIGKIGRNVRKDRKKYFNNTNCFSDPICRKNCLDVCIDYNNKWKMLHKI